MSSLVYKKHKRLLHKAFEMVAHDLKRMHKEGIEIGDVVFFAATLGIKGDLKFHHQMGNLSRSYYNVETKVNHPICSLCLAGRSGVDFENVSASATPCFKSSPGHKAKRHLWLAWFRIRMIAQKQSFGLICFIAGSVVWEGT